MTVTGGVSTFNFPVHLNSGFDTGVGAPVTFNGLVTVETELQAGIVSFDNTLFTSDGSGNVNVATLTATGQISSNGGNFTTDSTGNVHVVGEVNTAALRIPTGAFSGAVLTSDANGEATWQPAPTSGGGGGGAFTGWTCNMTASPDARCKHGSRLTCVSPTGQVRTQNIGCITEETTVYTAAFTSGVLAGGSLDIRLSRVGSQACLSVPGVSHNCPTTTDTTTQFSFTIDYPDNEYTSESGYMYYSGSFQPSVHEPFGTVVPCKDSNTWTSCVWSIVSNGSGGFQLIFSRLDKAAFACATGSASPAVLKVDSAMLPYLANWLS